MPRLSPIRKEQSFLWLVLIGGLVLRLLWLERVHGSISGFYSAAEATDTAIAIAQGRGIADPFFTGYGPSAHLLPIAPTIASLPIWLFGIGPVSAVAVLAWSLFQSAAAYLLLRTLFHRLGSDPLVTRWGLALLCLAMPFAPQEVIDFRFWEGASALCLAALNLLLILRFEDTDDFGWRAMLLAAVLSAITFFLSPPVGLAVDACWALFALKRLSFGRCARFAALSAAALAVFLVPWTIRNTQLLGEPVLLRSNAGLEFALANHPAAVSGRDPEHVVAARLKDIHPYGKAGAGQAALRAAGGELPYSRQIGAQAWRWARDHPGDFARLSLRHLREFFFPRAWQMYFSGWEGMRHTRATTMSLVSLLGLIGLAKGLYRRRRGYAMLAVYLAVVALPYALFQPMPRYIYLAYGVLAFLAVEALVDGFRYAIGRKGPGWAR